MEKIIEKIDSYNLFTSIVPGLLILMFNAYYLKLPELKVGEQIIIAYFVGQTINRLGSIVTGPILLKLTKEKGEPYNKYIKACEKDNKINTLLQERDAFRTYCTLVLVCIIEIIIKNIVKKYNISACTVITVGLLILFLIYAISYCNYNSYIAKRVKIATQKTKDKKEMN